MFTKQSFWGVLFFVLSLFSCETPEKSSIVEENSYSSLPGASLGVGSELVFVDGTESHVKSGLCIDVMAATSVTAIPTYSFSPLFNYKWSYQHVTQPDTKSCSWTSYVICVGALANAVALQRYPVSTSQVYVVKAGCGGSSFVPDLAAYANTVDQNFVSCSVRSVSKSASNAKLSIIKEMLYRLYTDKAPFIAVAKVGSIAHFVVVYGIAWKQGLTGSKIYYIDPLTKDAGSFDANLSCMDFTSFLSLMETNSNNNYNTLMFWPR